MNAKLPDGYEWFASQQLGKMDEEGVRWGTVKKRDGGGFVCGLEMSPTNGAIVSFQWDRKLADVAAIVAFLQGVVAENTHRCGTCGHASGQWCTFYAGMSVAPFWATGGAHTSPNDGADCKCWTRKASNDQA